MKKEILMMLGALLLISCSTSEPYHAQQINHEEKVMFNSFEDMVSEAKKILEVKDLYIFNLDYKKLEMIGIKSVTYNIYYKQTLYWNSKTKEYEAKENSKPLENDGIKEFSILQNFVLEDYDKCFGFTLKSYIGYKEANIFDANNGGQEEHRDAVIFGDDTFKHITKPMSYYEWPHSSDNQISKEIEVPNDFWKVTVDEMFSNQTSCYYEHPFFPVFDIYTHYSSYAQRPYSHLDSINKDITINFLNYGEYKKY